MATAKTGWNKKIIISVVAAVIGIGVLILLVPHVGLGPVVTEGKKFGIGVVIAIVLIAVIFLGKA